MKIKLNDSSFVLEKDNTEIDVFDKLNNSSEQDLLVEVTYSQLKTLIGNNNLVPGCKYAIIDYFSKQSEEWVDLGLPSGNLWCSHNLRAINSEEEGCYYAWGEIIGFDDAQSRNNFYHDDTGFSVDTYQTSGGADIDDDILLPEHDAANIYYGNDVRIPSVEDFEELCNSDYTSIEFTKHNDVFGVLITSKTNNNSIFIPNTSLYERNNKVSPQNPYLLSSVKADDDDRCHILYIMDGYYEEYSGTYERCCGYQIRPVCNNKPGVSPNKTIICTALSTNQLSENCSQICDKIISANNLRLYKTDKNIYGTEVDKEEWYKFSEVVEFDGKTYYKWIKYEDGEETDDCSILTSVLYKPGDLSLYNWSEDYIFLYNDEHYEEGKSSDDKLVLVECDDINIKTEELKVGYCVNNDIERFPWCDPEGKGVIYATKNLFYDSEAKAIDLGLPSGTLWADRNIGADNIEDYGQYFMHGDTEGYNDNDGIKCTGNYSNNKWDGLYGCVKAAYYPYNANNPNIPIAFDAARKKLCNKWEMPTEEQLNELLNNDYTIKSFEEFNGVKGLLITSRKNNNSIFLPAAGYISSTGIVGRTTSGCYWSKKMISQTTAVELGFDSGGNSASSQSRQYGCNIRAVYKP